MIQLNFLLHLCKSAFLWSFNTWWYRYWCVTCKQVEEPVIWKLCSTFKCYFSDCKGMCTRLCLSNFLFFTFWVGLAVIFLLNCQYTSCLYDCNEWRRLRMEISFISLKNSLGWAWKLICLGLSKIIKSATPLLSSNY